VALGKKELFPQGPSGPPTDAPQPVRRPLPFTPVSFALVGVSIAVFFVGWARPEVQALGVLHGPWVAKGEWWRIFTSLVTHGGPLHLFFNLSVVWTVGRTLELALGSVRFLLVTLVTGLGAGVFILAFNFDARTVGLSGAILGWLGVLLPVVRPEGRRELVTWLVQIAVLSLLPGISWAGHLGGFVFGLPLGLALRLGKKVFSAALPVTAFVAAILAWFAGTGHFR
jgi:rhomboid protease GluP